VPRDADVATRLSRRIALNIPSSPRRWIPSTEARMAIAIAAGRRRRLSCTATCRSRRRPAEVEKVKKSEERHDLRPGNGEPRPAESKTRFASCAAFPHLPASRSRRTGASSAFSPTATSRFREAPRSQGRRGDDEGQPRHCQAGVSPRAGERRSCTRTASRSCWSSTTSIGCADSSR